jgi:hypothetical protein
MRYPHPTKAWRKYDVDCRIQTFFLQYVSVIIYLTALCIILPFDEWCTDIRQQICEMLVGKGLAPMYYKCTWGKSFFCRNEESMRGMDVGER